MQIRFPYKFSGFSIGGFLCRRPIFAARPLYHIFHVFSREECDFSIFGRISSEIKTKNFPMVLSRGLALPC